MHTSVTRLDRQPHDAADHLHREAVPLLSRECAVMEEFRELERRWAAANATRHKLLDPTEGEAPTMHSSHAK